MVIHFSHVLIGLIHLSPALRFIPVVQYTFTGKSETGKLFYSVLHVVISVYIIIFGVFIALFAIFFPSIVSVYFGFYRVWWGRGLLFIFLSGIVLTNAIINVATAVLLLVFGIIFIVLHFIPIIPSPKPLINVWNYE